jgi:hypothetical protein
MNNKTYEISCWNPDTNSEYVKTFTLEDMIRNPNLMYMADVGLILLNIEREKLGLELINKNSITRYRNE